MSWSPITLSGPTSAASVSADLMLFEITPWTHGVREGVGIHTHLSFPNAVTAVSTKLAGQTDPVLIIAITAANETDFAKQCSALNSAFPLKQLQQWQQQASRLAVLETNKLNLIEPTAEPNKIAIHAVPTAQSLHKAHLSQAAKADAANLAASDPLAHLAVLESKKTAFDNKVDQALTEATSQLTGGAGWVFYSANNPLIQLHIGHPGSEYTLTAMLVLLGAANQLQLLHEILC